MFLFYQFYYLFLINSLKSFISFFFKFTEVSFYSFYIFFHFHFKSYVFNYQKVGKVISWSFSEVTAGANKVMKIYKNIVY